MIQSERQTRLWEMALVDGKGPGSLVHMARQGRLAKLVGGSYVTVGLNLLDESVLALIEIALAKRSNITFVYPSPAGEVSVLLAAQILITRLFAKNERSSVGLVTADTVGAARTWNQLEVGRSGERVGLAEVFGCIRAGPNGEYPLSRRSFSGLLIGRQFRDWPCDYVIRDHIAGPAPGIPSMPTISIYSDPLAADLEESSKGGDLIWGWGPSEVALLQSATKVSASQSVPFSVATDRFSSIAEGVNTTIHVSRNGGAEKHAGDLKDDLITLRGMSASSKSNQLDRGLRRAWHHQRTLQSLPVRPSDFDQFSGNPPIAAQSTATYVPELRAWARSLGGEVGELAEIVAYDIDDLRHALEESPPFLGELSRIASESKETIVIVGSSTAARALTNALGGDSESNSIGNCHIVPIRSLHRTGTWDRAYFVGTPQKWDWHRLDSGLTTDLHILVMGDREAGWTHRSLQALREARKRWASAEYRRRLWTRLVGAPLPPDPEIPEGASGAIEFVGAVELPVLPDPFDAFASVLVSSPIVDEEVQLEALAVRNEAGDWVGEVDVVEVLTEAGVIRLPVSRMVDVRQNTELKEVRADQLRPGMLLILSRTAGRVGLLNAISERLRTQRPDLYAAAIVIEDLRSVIGQSFQRSGLSAKGLHERLTENGFRKTYQATRGYVSETGPLAPRDYADLERLNAALQMGYDSQRLHQVFASVTKERTFRRATGRALAAAARHSLEVPATDVEDDALGLSTSDLQELVLEARIQSVQRSTTPVPVSETGFLT